MIDHNCDGQERKMIEHFGVLRNIKRRGDAIYGDLHYLKSHPRADEITERAERMGDTFGLSHNADGYTVHRNGREIVEDIEEVRSVDLVTDPATSSGLFESKSVNAIRSDASTVGQFQTSAEVLNMLRGNEPHTTPLSMKGTAMRSLSLREMSDEIDMSAKDSDGVAFAIRSKITELAQDLSAKASQEKIGPSKTAAAMKAIEQWKLDTLAGLDKIIAGMPSESSEDVAESFQYRRHDRSAVVPKFTDGASVLSFIRGATATY